METEEKKKKAKALGINTVVMKKDNTDYKKINTYKSTGTLIYDKNLFNRIENRIVLKK